MWTSESHDLDAQAYALTCFLERMQQFASEHERQAVQLSGAAAANRDLQLEFSKLQQICQAWTAMPMPFLCQGPPDVRVSLSSVDPPQSSDKGSPESNHLEDPVVADERVDVGAPVAAETPADAAMSTSDLHLDKTFDPSASPEGSTGIEEATNSGNEDGTGIRRIVISTGIEETTNSGKEDGTGIRGVGHGESDLALLSSSFSTSFAPSPIRSSPPGKAEPEDAHVTLRQSQRQQAEELVRRISKHSDSVGSVRHSKTSASGRTSKTSGNTELTVAEMASSGSSKSVAFSSQGTHATGVSGNSGDYGSRLTRAPSKPYLSITRKSTAQLAMNNEPSLREPGDVDPRLRGVTIARMSGANENLLFEQSRGSIKVGSTLVSEGVLLQRLVSAPGNRTKLMWDILGAVLVLYDVIMIPFVQAFDPYEAQWMQVVTWLAAVFWTLDMPKSFFSGYHHRGILEMRLHKVMQRYLRTWFLFDCVVLIIDWTFLLFKYLEGMETGSAVSLMRSGRWLRALRILRACRLIRIARLVRLLNSVMNSFSAEVLRVRLQALAALLAICVLNHIIACAWYALGSRNDMGRTWIMEYELVYQYTTMSLSYRYLTSLHWALTQCTPASMEVFPANSFERAYAVIVLVFGLFTFSSFVSAITQKMTQLFSITHDKLCQNVNMRRYFSEKRLSLECTEKILDFLDFKMSENQKRIHEDDIPILKVLPERIRIQMHVEVYMPALLWIPFFEYFEELDNTRLRSICHAAVTEQTLLQDQELFMKGAQGTSVYFVSTGTLTYHRRGQECDVHHEEWVSEAALWMLWIHRGRMSASGICEIYVLDAAIFNVFISCIQPSTKTAVYAETYAFEFANLDNMSGGHHLSDLCIDREQMSIVAANAFHKALRLGHD